MKNKITDNILKKRISILEAKNKRLIEENEKLKKMIVNFEEQQEMVSVLREQLDESIAVFDNKIKSFEELQSEYKTKINEVNEIKSQLMAMREKYENK